MKKVSLWRSQTQNIVQAAKFTTLTEVQKRAVQASEQIALFPFILFDSKFGRFFALLAGHSSRDDRV